MLHPYLMLPNLKCILIWDQHRKLENMFDCLLDWDFTASLFNTSKFQRREVQLYLYFKSKLYFHFLKACNSKTRHVRPCFGKAKMHLGGVFLFWFFSCSYEFSPPILALWTYGLLCLVFELQSKTSKNISWVQLLSRNLVTKTLISRNFCQQIKQGNLIWMQW